MNLPVQVTFHGFEPTPAIEAEIHKRAARLDRYYGRITGCRVMVEAPHRHHRHGFHYRVRVDITVPEGEIVIGHEPALSAEHADINVAIRDAFRAARRRVQDHARRLRGEVKTHHGPEHARVAKLFPIEGYGFIETGDGREIYFHRRSVLDDGFVRLRIGDEVRFSEEQGIEGPQASTVAPVGRLAIRPETQPAPET
jgi:cold shock CspA family protein/ribosome-associated translation inhibitor RaiA